MTEYYKVVYLWDDHEYTKACIAYTVVKKEDYEFMVEADVEKQLLKWHDEMYNAIVLSWELISPITYEMLLEHLSKVPL